MGVEEDEQVDGAVRRYSQRSAQAGPVAGPATHRESWVGLSSKQTTGLGDREPRHRGRAILGTYPIDLGDAPHVCARAEVPPAVDDSPEDSSMVGEPDHSRPGVEGPAGPSRARGGRHQKRPPPIVRQRRSAAPVSAPQVAHKAAPGPKIVDRDPRCGDARRPRRRAARRTRRSASRGAPRQRSSRPVQARSTQTYTPHPQRRGAERKEIRRKPSGGGARTQTQGQYLALRL